MADSDPLLLRFAEFELNEADARLMRAGQPVPLPPKAFAVLCSLVRQRGRLVAKNALLDEVWGHRFISESVLKTTVSELRAALEDDARHPRFIETAARRGYRFISPADALPSGLPAVIAPTPTLHAAARSTNVPLRAIVGRKAALARLHAVWGAALDGRRQICWVAGEAGIGKTTLIERFTAELGDAMVAHGQCVEQFGAGEPYLPVLDALGTLSRIDADLTPMLRSIAPTWMLQFPWLTSASERDGLRRELAGATQERMLRELGELLDRYTQMRPLLLITEDLHWGDRATLQLLDHFARRRTPARLMWLASFRLTEVVAAEHPLKNVRHELRLHRLCEEIVLESFSEREVAEYVEDRFPEIEVSEALVRALHERTDGLPLFVSSVLDDFDSRGVLAVGERQHLPSAEEIAALAVPESLAGVIEKQISRLSQGDCAMLEAASVWGVEFEPRRVAEVLELDSDDVAQRCDAFAREQQWLSRARLGRLPDGSINARHAFRHALYRNVFYDRIGTLRRVHLHRRVAACLERAIAPGVAENAAELAAHYELAHDVPAALRCYAQAAENALRHFAPAEAMGITAHALALLGQVSEGPQRHVAALALFAMRGVAAAQALGVSAPETKGAFERAHALLDQLPDHPLGSLVRHGLGLVLFVRGEYDGARSLGERSRALADASGDRPLYIAACDLLGQVNTLQGRPEEGLDWLNRGIAAAKEVGDQALEASFLVDPVVTMHAVMAIPLLLVGLPEQGQAQLDRALARAERLRQPMSILVANWFGALFEVRTCDPVRLSRYADRLRAIADEASLGQGEAPSCWYRGFADALHGDARNGNRLIRRGYEHNVALGMLSGASEVLGYATEALIIDGNWEAAAAQLDEALQLAMRLDERAYLPRLLALKGRIARGCGDHRAARQAILAALQEGRAQGAIWMEVMALTELCELDEPTAADFQTLELALARLTEGFQAPLVRRADALLRRRAGSTPRG